MRLDSRFAAAAVMAAVFVSGAVTGGVLSRTVFDDDPRPEWARDRDDRRGPDRGPREGADRERRDGPRAPRGIMSSRAVEHLADRLELREPQRDSLEAILERQRARAAAVFEDIGPSLRAVLDSTTTDIRQMLDPDQQAEFDAIVREDRGVLGRRWVPRDSTGRR